MTIINTTSNCYSCEIISQGGAVDVMLRLMILLQIIIAISKIKL